VTERRLTAKTIYCDAVDDDATIIVYKDWRTKCTGYDKYSEGLNRKQPRCSKRKPNGWAEIWSVRVRRITE
jgi:hypothetical protein